MSMRSRLITLGALVGAAIAPGAAHAATTCGYNLFNGDVDIYMSVAGDSAKIDNSGGAIRVNGTQCGIALTGYTDAILVHDVSGGGTTLAVDLSGGQLAPGLNPKQGDPSPTIPIYYDAGAGSDTFEVFGSPQDETIHVGSALVNLDAGAEAQAPDADVNLQSVEIVDVNGGAGADTIDASAHPDTGPAFGGLLYEEGAQGNDHLTAGSGTASVMGGAGDDTLNAGGQGQFLASPGTGDDTVTGEPLANDMVSYGDAPDAVHVDLSRTDKQDTGGAGADKIDGFRKLAGTIYNDVLAGTNGADSIQGGNGDDLLIGRAGDDKLLGGLGTNTVSYAEPSIGVQTGVMVSLATQGVAQNTGSEGTDTLSGMSGLIGSPFDDTLTGDGGANRIDGGGGSDTVNAGDGPDTVLLRDGISDHADCGGADDTVESDVQGLDVLTGCEQVAFAPFTPPVGQPAGDPQPPSQPGAADTSLTFRFTAKKHQRLGKRGIVRGSLLCPDEACSSQVSAKFAARRAANRTVAVPAGTAKVVKLRLGAGNVRRARAALHAGRKVTVRVTAIARDAAGNRQTVTRTIRLRA
jgi:RTX calcium-binding nonapeptide repeat (4 copies)